MTKFYAAVGTALLGLYAAAGFLGWEFGFARETAEKSTARHAAGGHRSVWITGYHGGK